MSRIEKRVKVDLSLERRFHYTAPMANSSELWPGLLEIGEVGHLPDGGSIARWGYKWNGTLFEDCLKSVEQATKVDLFGSGPAEVEIAMIWDYQPENGLPRIVIDGDHTLWSPC